MSSLFSAEQYDAAYPDGIEHHWWMTARTKIVASVIRATSDGPPMVLEIGCGKGVVVRGLRDMGVACWGVELAPVTPLPDVTAYVVTATNALDLPESLRMDCDTILLLDVLEHLTDPMQFLHTLEAGFASLRRIIVTVPARPEVWSNYDEHYGHQQRYTLEQLRVLATRMGWRLRSARYFFHSLYPLAWVMARMKLDRDVRLRAPQQFARVLHRVLALIMMLDYQALPGSLAGTSAMACFDLRGSK